MFLQMFGARKKQVQGFLRIFQTLDMGEKAAGFHGKNKMRWNLSAPALEYRFARKPIETVIDLNGIEVPHKVLQPL